MLFLTACPGAGPRFALTVDVAGAGSGSVSSDPAGIDCGSACSAGFAEGTRVALLARPATGSVFAGWSGACTGTGSCTVTMDRSRSVTARFEPSQTVRLTVAKDGTGSGSLTSDPAGIDCGGTCSAAFPEDAVVTITATSDPGSAFDKWGENDCVSQADNKCTVIMHAERSVTATFANTPPFVNLQLGDRLVSLGAADVTVDLAFYFDDAEDNPSALTYAVTDNTDPGVVTASVGGTILTLSFGELGTSTITVEAEDRGGETVSDAFDVTVDPGAPIPLTVSKDGTGSGKVTSDPAGIDCGSDCAVEFPEGASVTLTATPDPGSVFDGWSGCDAVADDACTVTMDAAREVTATFTNTPPVVSTPIADVSATEGDPNGVIDLTKHFDDAQDDPADLTYAVTGNSDPTVVTASVSGTDLVLIFLNVDATSSATVTVRAEDRGGLTVSDPFEVTVEALLRVPEITDPTPNPLKLKAQAGSSVTGTITFGNVGEAPLSYSTSESLAWLEVIEGAAGNVAGGALQTIRVEATCPPEEGVLTGDLEIASNDADEPLKTVAVELECTEADFVAWRPEPATLTFSAAVGETPASQTFDLFNDGNVTGTYALTPPPWVSVEPTGGSVAGGGVEFDRITVSVGACTEAGTTGPDEKIVIAGNDDSDEVQVTRTCLPLFTLAVARDGAGSGSVVSDPAGISCGGTCEADFVKGTEVTLMPTPNPGSTFGGWGAGDCDSTAGDLCRVTMDADQAVTATFDNTAPYVSSAIADVVVPYGADDKVIDLTQHFDDAEDTPADLTYAVVGNTNSGVVTTSISGSDLTLAFGAAGTATITVEATDRGGLASNPDDVFTVTVRYTLTVNKAGTGTGSVSSNPAGIDCGSTCAATFVKNTSVTLTPTPAAGSTFEGWSGCDGTAGNQCTVAMNADRAVTATFSNTPPFVAAPIPAQVCTELNSLTIDLTAHFGDAEDGPANLTFAVTGNTNPSAVTPSVAGKDLTLSCLDVATTSTSTITIRATDRGGRTVSDAFVVTVRALHILTVNKAGAGSGSVTSNPAGIDCGSTCFAPFVQGTVVTLTAAPDSGSVFGGWSGACTGTGSCIVTMDLAKTVTATFDPE